MITSNLNVLVQRKLEFELFQLRENGSFNFGEQIVRLGAVAQVFDIEVEGDHHYYVSESGVLSHNCDTGIPAKGSQLLLQKPKTIKHHVFNKFRGKSSRSQKYRDFFRSHGIKVDKYTIEIPESLHKDFIHKAGNNWTTRWKRWIDDNPNATTKEVYQFGGQLMQEYGLSDIALVPYR